LGTLAQNLRFVSVGIFVVLAGHTLEARGMAREQPASRPGSG
jgi:hypothetical protein